MPLFQKKFGAVMENDTSTTKYFKELSDRLEIVTEDLKHVLPQSVKEQLHQGIQYLREQAAPETEDHSQNADSLEWLGFSLQNRRGDRVRRQQT